MGWPKIRGKEQLARLRGPVVFISNHVTMVDHALVLFALPARFNTRMAIAQDGEILRADLSRGGNPLKDVGDS